MFKESQELFCPADYRKLVQAELDKRLEKKHREKIDLSELWKNHGGNPELQNLLSGQLFSKLFEDPFDYEDQGCSEGVVKKARGNALGHANWLVREIAKRLLKVSVIKTENQPPTSEVPNEATATNGLSAQTTE